MLKKNEGILDRYIRLLLGTILIIGGYFWLSGAISLILILVGVISMFTAITGFCALYKLVNISTVSKKVIKNPRITHTITILLYIIFIILGVYYSNFFTKKIFIEDFNKMNNFYKQTLFYTGQDNRAESLSNYEKLITEYVIFNNKYQSYQPYALKGDDAFNDDLNRVSQIIVELDDDVRSGDLKSAHLDFEKIRPIFQEIFKRNGFSMLSITLVDFHDAMEKILDTANEKDIIGTLSVYDEVNQKLIDVEAIANDDEIKNIRTNLDEIKLLAEEGKSDNLPKKASDLKSSFVKVYLKRG